MLPSLGFSEMVLIGILALVVVGPKDLPLMLRKLGRWTAKLRGMAQEFRTGFDELARQAELDELKKEVDALRRATSDIGRDVQREFNRPLAPDAVKPALPSPISSAPTTENTPAPPLEEAAADVSVEAEADAPPPRTMGAPIDDITTLDLSDVEERRPEPSLIEPAPARSAT
jgi:sec-independent protein translocase protein TatB